MAIATRDRAGRARARYSDTELYGLVRRVAVWVNRRRPTKVTQAEFDRARSGAGVPDAPSARAICMRLGANGVSRPWREVLEASCAERASLEISAGHQRGNGDGSHLGRQHLYFALNAAAQHLQVRSLTPGDYERARQELAEREARRRNGRHPHQPHLLSELMPNADRIERIARGETAVAGAGDAGTAGVAETTAEDADPSPDRAENEPAPEDARPIGGGRGRARGDAAWDIALRIAGLEPRHETVETRRRSARKVKAMPLAEAFHHFVDANGRWPSRDALLEFASILDIAVATKPRDKSWAEVREEARAYRAELGLTSPTEDPDPVATRGLEVRVPAEGIAGVPRRAKRGRGRITEEDCLAALDRFDRELPPRAARTRRAYARFAAEHGLPSPTTIDRNFDGFKKMMMKMRQRRES